jgi:hypothetical protein
MKHTTAAIKIRLLKTTLLADHSADRAYRDLKQSLSNTEWLLVEPLFV